MVLEEKQKLGRYTQPLRANRQIGAQYLSLPPELQVRYFKTPEELGELVMRDWIGIVDFLYPVIDRAVFSNTESETFQQWAAHETFAAQRRSVFIRTAQTREVMDLFSMHGEVGQDIKRKTSMVLSTALLGTFMTSLPSIDSLPPILVIVGELNVLQHHLHVVMHVEIMVRMNNIDNMYNGPWRLIPLYFVFG